MKSILSTDAVLRHHDDSGNITDVVYEVIEAVARTCLHHHSANASADPLRAAPTQTACLNATTPSADAAATARPTGDCGDGPIPLPIAVVGATLGSLILATGIFGNVLILAAVWRYRPLRKTANAFVASLAVCDLFHTAFVRPLYVHTYVAGGWEFGAATCVYALVASNLAILESILHVTMIAFHRYVALVHPRCAGCLQRRAFVGFLLVAVYVGPLVAVLGQSWPRLAGGVVLGRDVVFNRRIMFCSFVRHSEFRPISVVKKAAFVSLSAAFIAFCYIRIYRLVRTRGRRLSIHGTFNPVRIHREMTLLRTVVAVFVAFVVNYMPITIVYGVDTKRTLPYIAYFVGVLLLWISPSANWIIYGLMNVQYARAYRYLLCRGARRKHDRSCGGAGGIRRYSAGGVLYGPGLGSGVPASRRSTQLGYANGVGGSGIGGSGSGGQIDHESGEGRPFPGRQMSLWSTAYTTNGATTSDVEDGDADSHKMVRFCRNDSSSSSTSCRRSFASRHFQHQQQQQHRHRHRCCSVVEFSTHGGRHSSSSLSK